MKVLPVDNPCGTCQCKIDEKIPYGAKSICHNCYSEHDEVPHFKFYTVKLPSE